MKTVTIVVDVPSDFSEEELDQTVQAARFTLAVNGLNSRVKVGARQSPRQPPINCRVPRAVN